MLSFVFHVGKMVVSIAEKLHRGLQQVMWNIKIQLCVILKYFHTRMKQQESSLQLNKTLSHFPLPPKIVYCSYPNGFHFGNAKYSFFLITWVYRYLFQVDKIVTFHLQPVNEYPPDVNTVPDINISEVGSPNVLLEQENTK